MTIRYSFENHIKKHDIGDIMFILAFSGGGTRAAALSYGVLEELKNTYYETSGKQQRLLDEVDRINSVSGGSFTAAYYGLFGDKLFNDLKMFFYTKMSRVSWKAEYSASLTHLDDRFQTQAERKRR